jgi:hypothetical protein
MAVIHDEQGRISEASLTRQIMISICQGNTFHRILVVRHSLWYNILGDMLFELLQEGLIVLQVTCTSMKSQDTHEDVFVVDKLATDLILSIWACCKGKLQFCISTYQYILVYTGMYGYVLVHTSGD